MEETRVIPRPDGSALQVRVSGPAEGQVLVYHHGTPGGATPFRLLEGPAHARGWRVVCLARPGYGDSSRRPGHRIVDVVEDTNVVLDALGAPSCLVAGWSGGGPRALACAARLERAAAALVIGGLAPRDGEGLDFMAGKGERNLKGMEAALEGPEVLRRHLEALAPLLQELRVDRASSLAEQWFAAVDREVLTGELAEDLVAEFREGVRGGVEGWLDDERALVSPWGFRVGDVDRPVTLWHGTEDQNVPVAHGRWLAAHVPGVRAHIVEGEGHVSVGVRLIEEMLEELASAASS